MKVLRIDASARVDRSLSRALADRFVEQWKHLRPDDDWILRDVGMNPPPFVTQPFIQAAFTKPVDRTREDLAVLAPSDELIAEVKTADLILLVTPMYNYGVPAALKAWFDQVIRVNETFSFDLKRGDRPLRPIQRGKVLVLLTSTGEFGFQQHRFLENHLDPHVETMSYLLGVEKVHRIGIQYQEFGDQRHQESKDKAHKDVVDLANKLSEDF